MITNKSANVRFRPSNGWQMSSRNDEGGVRSPPSRGDADMTPPWEEEARSLRQVATWPYSLLRGRHTPNGTTTAAAVLHCAALQRIESQCLRRAPQPAARGEQDGSEIE